MISETSPLLLGSASPRRREILAQLGLPFTVAAADVDESLLAGENARDYVARIVLAKLAAVGSLRFDPRAGGVLVADTSVVVDDFVLQKPADEADARTMLRLLSGRAHEVLTAFALAEPRHPGVAVHTETVASRVVFRALDDDEIARYAATGEGRDKAGGYAIQGIGAFAVARIEGSYSTIVGLPACELIAALRACGLIERFPLTR
jgi:septum formation protein